MPADADRSILVRANVRLALKMGKLWLENELTRVTLAMNAGAQTIKTLALTGMTASGENEMRTDVLVEILDTALAEMNGETSVGTILYPRFAPDSIPL